MTIKNGDDVFSSDYSLKDIETDIMMEEYYIQSNRIDLDQLRCVKDSIPLKQRIKHLKRYYNKARDCFETLRHLKYLKEKRKIEILSKPVKYY